MLTKRFVRPISFLVLLIAVLMIPTVVSAWWSGWVSPNFSGSYSPTAYQYGQYDSTWNGGTEVFAARMKWNQTRADGVRSYSKNRRWISWCGYCYAYYTHDHTDVSNRLHALGYVTNFPSAKSDVDDDDGNGRWEEFEVTSLDQSFPTTNAEYYFYTYFARRSIGSGWLYQTPAVSARNLLSGEYDTYRYDRSIAVSYYSNSSRRHDRAQEDRAARRSARAEGSLFANDALNAFSTDDDSLGQSFMLEDSPYGLTVTSHELTPVVEANLSVPLETYEQIERYRTWAKSQVIQDLRAAGVSKVLTIITFNQPVATPEVQALVATLEDAKTTSVKAILRDTSNADESSNIWTVGLVNLETNDLGVSSIVCKRLSLMAQPS